ncbi:MAG TPA: hypothetical protein VG165_02840 [Solirubrobacteraceae bacterium]|jgi:hypothetical protein|nr:hypothetical protein [Solirubrobacteraceae bacterium]
MQILASLISVSALFQALFAGGLLVVACVAASYARAQLAEQRAIASRDRVYALVDRCSDLRFVRMMDNAIKFFALGAWDGKARWNDTKSLTLRLEVVTLLNFCEEVAGEYLDGLLDKSVADRNVAYIAVTVWRDSEWFVQWIRDTSGEQLAWKELENLASLFSRRDAVTK